MERCPWQSELNLDYRCPELAHEPGQLCILHRVDKEKDVSLFNEQVNNKKKRGDFNFRGVFFPVSISFKGELKDANFSEASFEQSADFSYATFQGETNFSRATFRGNAVFGETTFQGQVSYFRAVFVSAADFWEAAFREAADFCTVSFRGAANFSDALFRKAADFSKATFEGEEARLVFQGVLLEEPEKVWFEGMDLSRATFAGTNVRPIEFHDVTWPKTMWGRPVAMISDHRGRRYESPRLVRRLWHRVRLFLSHSTAADQFAHEDHPERLEKARQVCRDLKGSLEDRRDYADAGDFYYAEMELKRKQLGSLRGFPLFVYWLFCAYGEKPLRALVIFAGLCLLLATGFTHTWFTAAEHVKWRGIEFGSKQEFQPLWIEAVGHAIRSLTLQQRGGYLTPFSPGATRLTLAANLVGPIQLGLFFLAMRRRFRR